MSRQKFEEEMDEFVRSEMSEMLGRIDKKYPNYLSDMKVVGESDFLGIKRKSFNAVVECLEQAIKSAIRWREWMKND